MKKIVHILLLSFFVFSCSSDNDEPTIPKDNETIVLEGKQVFRIDLKELTAKSLSVGNQKNQEPAFVLLSLNDVNGNSILTREKVALIKDGNSYVTDEITLESGTYTVIEFIVIDANDVVISMAPKENSALAQFATNPLPFDFVVTSDETKETVTENINAAGYTSVDFGYTGLSLTFPENTDFFSLTVDETENTTTKTLNLKSVTGATYLVDWGDGTIDEYVSTIIDSGIDNTINHSYVENGIYTITIRGAIESIVLLEFNSNDSENNWQSHLTNINIEDLTLLKSCKLNAGKLIALNTSNNQALETLNLGANQITTLDLNNNHHLKTITLNFNRLSSLDLSQNTDLEVISLNNNEISTLELSNNSKLKVLLARDNFLSTIDLSNNPHLERTDIANNDIANIDISSNLALIEINLGTNQLTTIDLTNNINLLRIDLFQNQLTSIDVSNNLKLMEIYLQNMTMASIDLSANTDLERLYIDNNNLNTLDLSTNTKISHLNIGGNQFDGLMLDQILIRVYDNAILNSISDGYINYINNIGTTNIDQSTISKLNELIADYNWFFNNG